VCSTLAGFSQPSLLLFEGTVNKEGAIELAWSVNRLQPATSHFEIQKSADGIDWITEAIIFCDENAMVVSHKYIRKTKDAQNVSYRICEVKMNGEESFSHVEIFSTDANEAETKSGHGLYVVQLKEANGKMVSKKLML
jgi:hypothetical protein